MEIMTKQDIVTGQVFANVVLTEEEVEKLVKGKVVNGDVPEVSIQIVGYGDDGKKEAEEQG